MHDMMVHAGSSIIIKLGTIWKELVSSPGRITPGYPMFRRVNEHLNWSINFRGKTNLVSYSQIRTADRPVSSLDTDRAEGSRFLKSEEKWYIKTT